MPGYLSKRAILRDAVCEASAPAPDSRPVNRKLRRDFCHPHSAGACLVCRSSSWKTNGKKSQTQPGRRPQICSPKTQPGCLACGLAASRHLRGTAMAAMAVLSVKFSQSFPFGGGGMAAGLDRTGRSIGMPPGKNRHTISRNSSVFAVVGYGEKSVGVARAHSTAFDSDEDGNPSTCPGWGMQV